LYYIYNSHISVFIFRGLRPHFLLTGNLMLVGDLRYFLKTLFSPHLCVWFLFLVLHSRLLLPSSRRLPPPQHTHTQLPHTQLVHTQLVHTYSHTTCPHRPCSQLVHLHLAGLVLGDIDLHFVGQAWHVWHWAVSGGALGPEWPGWPPRLLAWQAWHFATSTFVSRGRCGTW
jgi:hypothetical protein